MTEPTEPDPDRFITSAEADHESVFGPVVITLPEDLTPEQMSTVPDLPTERAATDLLPLLEELARQTDRDESEYVQVAGAIREFGHVGLYQVLAAPASRQVNGYVVAWTKDGDFDLRTFPASAEETAKEVYDLWAEGLDGDRSA